MAGLTRSVTAARVTPPTLTLSRVVVRAYLGLSSSVGAGHGAILIGVARQVAVVTVRRSSTVLDLFSGWGCNSACCTDRIESGFVSVHDIVPAKT